MIISEWGRTLSRGEYAARCAAVFGGSRITWGEVWDDMQYQMLHDPDCPMVNRSPAARTGCVCELMQHAPDRNTPEGEL